MKNDKLYDDYIKEMVKDEILVEKKIFNKQNVNVNVHGLVGIPVNFEPLRANRYVLTFPPEFNILPWTVSQISMPSIDRRPRYSFRDDTPQDLMISYGNLTITLIQLIGNEGNDQIRFLMDCQRTSTRFNLVLQQLDSTGNSVREYNISVAYIESIDMGDLSMDMDNTANLTVRFCVENLTINY